MHIDTFAQHKKDSAAVTAKIREIFFLSADPKNISDDQTKNDEFFAKWTGYYFSYEPEWILLAWEGERLLGYIMVGTNSRKAVPYYDSRNPSFRTFADQFDLYPAHLHINCHPSARGQGVGTFLIEDASARLIKKGLKGLHLITSPTQRNVSFYRRNGFSFELQREYKGYALLFMGRKLSPV